MTTLEGATKGPVIDAALLTEVGAAHDDIPHP
jgi:hypothetical protein